MQQRKSKEDLEQRLTELKDEAERLKTAEEALRKSQRQLSEIVQGSPIATFVIDDSHIITHCNRAFENLTGITPGDIIGSTDQWKAFYPKKRPVLADFIVNSASASEIAGYYGAKFRKSTVIEGGYEAEDYFSGLAGQGRWLFFTAAPLKDGEGNITGAIETLQDITDRKRAEEEHVKSEIRYRTLLDFAPYPIVVFTLNGLVTYLNPSFTEIFGWTLDELEGKNIPYVPPGLEQETHENIERLFEEKQLVRFETKRLTKDGRILDVIMRAAVFLDTEERPAGELVILRDITQEKRIARSNAAMLRISMALPEYPELEYLLDYVSNEVKRLVGTEGAYFIFLDEEREELYFLGIAHDRTLTKIKLKEIRFSMDELITGQVIRTGEPVIISDISANSELHRARDKKLGYHTKNLLIVPLRSSDRIIGAVCAINKKEGDFDQTDVELLSTIAATVVLSIENARFSEEIKRAYREVTGLNRAKDKVINHLSHELKTPVSVLSGSLNVLERRLSQLPEETWKRTVQRARNNVDRLLEIQYVVDDILEGKHHKAYKLLPQVLDQCLDEIEIMIAQEIGEGPLIDKIRKRIDRLFGPKQADYRNIILHDFVKGRIETLRPQFSHRQVKLETRMEKTPKVYMPLDPLEKVVDGLIKNAVENTPDQGTIKVIVEKHGEGASLTVHDYGVGITEESQRRIFEGFFSTQDTMAYSSKRPFDFNAGGKGADLLRMKIFSERYNFRIDMESSRCRFIPGEKDVCPGSISSCKFCRKKEDCMNSGGSSFSIFFSAAPDMS